MITLDGASLGVEALRRAASGAPVAIAPGARERMAAARAAIDHAIAARIPVYGVTTGLGARASETLDAPTLAAFSLRTLRGRAQAVGPAEETEVVRAAMVVRLNTLLPGHAGASVAVADHLLACLNAGLVPVVRRIGSIGPSDLVQNASLGLALTGEGRMEGPGGTGDAAEMMRAHGIAPLVPGPRDGLALAGHCGLTVATAALGLAEAETAHAAAQTAAALTLEAFRANLSPIDPRALAVKPLPGQAGAARDLAQRLEGSALWQAGQARRLQDPLSIRNLVQINGALNLALGQAREIVEIELNGASDSPIVLPDTGEVMSCGAFYTAELGLVCETLTRALVGVAMAQIARMAKMLDPRFSDLPMFLARPESGSNGFAPLMKTAEALVAEIAHAAQPPAIWPSVNANGVEDTLSTGPVAARALRRAVAAFRTLVALELMVGVQACEMRGTLGTAAPFLRGRAAHLRTLSEPLADDRPLGDDIDRIDRAIASGAFG